MLNDNQDYITLQEKMKIDCKQKLMIQAISIDWSVNI